RSNVITLYLKVDSKLPEFFGNDSQMVHTSILNSDVASRHSRQTNERSHLDHIRQHFMRCACEITHSFNGEQIAGNAADLRTHAIEHIAKLLDVRLAGSVVNFRGAICHHRTHDDVGSTRHRWLIK